MRVCIDLSPLWSGSRFRGIGGYALQLARALEATAPPGVELLALVGRGLGHRVEPFTPAAPGATTAVDALAREAAAAGPPPAYKIFYAGRATIGLARLAQARPDVWHATDPRRAPFPPGARTVLTCHDLIPAVLGGPYLPPWLPRRARVRMDTRLYGRAQHVIAISSWTRTDLLTVAGVRPERTSVVLHGVDRARWSQWASEDDSGDAADDARVATVVPGERPFFVYVGGFDARKRVPELVDTFGRRAGALQESLVICGRTDRWEARAIRRAAARHGVEDRVVQAGYVSDEALASLYRRATAHVMPSIYEGFGLTALEAFACGCPVIAARASSVPEVTAGAARLVPPDDGDALGDALVAVARDPILRACMRTAGLARAAELTWARSAEATLAVYRQAAGA